MSHIFPCSSKNGEIPQLNRICCVGKTTLGAIYIYSVSIGIAVQVLSEFIGAICIHRVPVRLIQGIKVLNQWS